MMVDFFDSTNLGLFSPVTSTIGKKIVKHNDIKCILDSARSGSLVILDLDHTVMRSVYHVGSEYYYHYCIDQCLYKGLSPEAAQYEANLIYNQVQKACDSALLADEKIHIGEYIRVLEQRGVKVIGLTARAPVLSDITLIQLNHLNVKFSEGVIDDMSSTFLDKPYQIKSGVIFANDLNKGGLLANIKPYFTGSFDTYHSVIFADDRHSNCLDVARFFQDEGIAGAVYHYAHMEESYPFTDRELKIALIQRAIFEEEGELLSNYDAFERYSQRSINTVG